MKRACGNGNIANVGCSLYIVIIGCRVHIGQNQGIIVSHCLGMSYYVNFVEGFGSNEFHIE